MEKPDNNNSNIVGGIFLECTSKQLIAHLLGIMDISDKVNCFLIGKDIPQLVNKFQNDS